MSIREVARRAGVSVGTVSNVLNRPHVVAETTRRRVLDAIEELGYVRNELARQLRAGRSRTIGFLALDVANPFFTDVAHGAESVADEAGAVLMLCNSREDPTREERHLDLLEEQRVQGVLITPVDGDNPRLQRLVERGIPVVLVDRGSPRPDRCSVAVDNRLGGRLAVEHLLEKGHRSLAFVGGPLSIPQVDERLDGARKALTQAQGVAGLRVVETPALRVVCGRHAGERSPDSRPGSVRRPSSAPTTCWPSVCCRA